MTHVCAYVCLMTYACVYICLIAYVCVYICLMTYVCVYICLMTCVCVYVGLLPYVKITTVKPVLTVHLWHKETVVFKWDSIHMEFYMADQEKCYLLIKVTACEDLTLFSY